jgi:hypothetical protein
MTIGGPLLAAALSANDGARQADLPLPRAATLAAFS